MTQGPPPPPLASPAPATEPVHDATLLHLAAIVESSDDAIIGATLEENIIAWNPAATRLFGYTRKEMMGRSASVLIPPELRPEHKELLERIKAGERVDQYEVQRMSKDGQRLDVSATVSPIRDDEGRVVGVSYIARSVSERRRAEEARLRLAAIVESSDDAIVGKDLNGIITDWNAAATRIFGYEPHEIIGQSVLRLIPPELQHEEPEILRRLRAGQRIEHYETVRVRKNGERIDVSLTVSPIKDATGRVIGASKIARDISERKQSEAALIESEKMAATGRMAAALAHEVNNPLESITNLAYLLANNPMLPDDAHQYAEMLVSEVGRASEIAKRTLTFYRQTSVPVDIRIEELLDSLLKFYQTKLESRQLRVNTEYRASGVIPGFPTELRQVFGNLLANAMDASQPGGVIRVRTSNSAGKDGESHMRITVADRGHGIPPQLRKRVFEPFFTTKHHKGHGLGLWVTRSIVRKHGGHIRVRSSARPGCSGTVFSIVLPCRFHPVNQNSVEAAERPAA